MYKLYIQDLLVTHMIHIFDSVLHGMHAVPCALSIIVPQRTDYAEKAVA